MVGSVGYDRIPNNDEEQLKRALRTKGPISTMFSVNNDFFTYRDGVYTAPSTCIKSGAMHALLVIGFGTDSATGKDYWLVQNSWGTGWGQKGFAKIERGKNTCGIASCASYPINI
jgi:C1A family cysteine protease